MSKNKKAGNSAEFRRQRSGELAQKMGTIAPIKVKNEIDEKQPEKNEKHPLNQTPPNLTPAENESEINIGGGASEEEGSKKEEEKESENSEIENENLEKEK